MSKFAIIRLGKDSVTDIKTIDALHKSPATPVQFTVHCKQVPTELDTGDYAFFCFGSDNSQGAPTDWVRGVRALGTIVRKTGEQGVLFAQRGHHRHARPCTVRQRSQFFQHHLP